MEVSCSSQLYPNFKSSKVITIKDSLVAKRQTAAQLLSAAACELYPGTLLAGGKGTNLYFYYDFIFPFVFQDVFIPLIEERMKAILREAHPICRREMMPSNAAGLFEMQGQPLVTERVLSASSSTVQICQIGERFDFCPEEFAEEFGQPYFKLLEVYDPEIPGKAITRIVGCLALDKADLKAIVKKTPPSKRVHGQLVRDLQFFQPLPIPGLWMWLPKAEGIRTSLCRLWQEVCIKQNIHLLATPNCFLEEDEQALAQAHVNFLSQTRLSRSGELCWIPQKTGEEEGLFSTAAAFTDRAYLVCTGEKLLEETISSLQFIFKILKILTFEFEIILSVSSAGTQKERQKLTRLCEEALGAAGREYTVRYEYRPGEHVRIEAQVLDALGRLWGTSFVSFPVKGEYLVRSLFGPMERLVALLVEQTAGNVPLWMAQEQVRILPVSGKNRSYAENVYQAMRAAGIRARVEYEPDPLKTRLYGAYREKVPYIVFVGESEEKTRSLTVRRGQESEERRMGLEELIEIMQGCETEWKRLI